MMLKHPIEKNKLFVLTNRYTVHGYHCCKDSGYVLLSKQICSFDYTVVTMFADKWRYIDQFMFQKSSRKEAGQSE